MYSSYLGYKAPRLLDFGLDIKAEANAEAGAGVVVVAAAAAVHIAKVRGAGRTRGRQPIRKRNATQTLYTVFWLPISQ